MASEYFYFKQFKLRNENAALKINTDGVLLGSWVSVTNSKSVLDVGTGSGVIALMLNQRISKASITAIDIDPVSCEEARFNVKLNKLNNIEVIESSFQLFSKKGIQFDHIVSNPPYFQNDTKSSQSKLNISKHNDQLSFEEFWEAASLMCHDGSKVSVVLPFEESKVFTLMAKDYNFNMRRMLKTRSRKGSEVKRVLMEYRKGHQDKIESEEIYIHNEGRNNYSTEYMALTRDFYLKM